MNFDTLYSKYTSFTALDTPDYSSLSHLITDLLCNPPTEGDEYYQFYTDDELEFLDSYFAEYFSKS